jgi:mannose-1-phosphate guanylyltransferase/mannose-6-phosphate isomerase
LTPYKITPVILSGGAGTRLWPLSHWAMPKQFHALGSERTMLQDTVLRVKDSEPLTFAPPVIICAEDHLATINVQLAAVDRSAAKIVLEPFGRNTAAAAYIAAAAVRDLDPTSLVLLLPADHVIVDPEAFMRVIATAAKTAASHIVTFGIEADRPETGYGYIQKGDRLDEGVFAVRRFAEKPSRERAEQYLAEEDYVWNAGIFLFAPDVMLREMAKLAPNIAEKAGLALTGAVSHGQVVRLDREAFGACPSEPVDIAVMEKTQLAAVAPCCMGWADVGSWSEIYRLGTKDTAENLLHGDAVAIETSNSLIWTDGAPVAVIGVDNLVVVSTSEGLLVLPMDRAQDLKLAIAAIKALREA